MTRRPYTGSRYNLYAQAKLDGGALTARFDQRPLGCAYLVRRAVVQGPANTVCRIYTGDPGARTLADGSNSGELDVADYTQPLYVEPGVELVAVWTSAVDGSNVTGTASIRIEIEELA